MKTFREHLTELGLMDSTANGYIVNVGLFAAWYRSTYGERLAGPFTPTDVREYKAHLQTVERMAAGTINHRLAALRAYGGYLVATGQLADNPAAHARGIKEQPAAPKWLDGKEQWRLTRELETAMLAARTDAAKREAARNTAIVITLVHTGLRLAELCALDVADVTIRERSGEVRVRAGKGDKARTVPLNLTARQALRGWLMLEERKPLDPIFTGRNGGERLTKRGVQKMIAELGRRAGVELTPHTLRHTFAKNLVNAGVIAEQIAPMMGHSSVATTAIYTVPDARDLARAVAALED